MPNWTAWSRWSSPARPCVPAWSVTPGPWPPHGRLRCWHSCCHGGAHERFLVGLPFPASRMAVGTAGLAVAGCVVARAPPPRQCLARPCGRAPAAAPAGAWRRAGPYRPGRGHPGVRAGRPGIGGPQLATGRSAAMAGPTAAGGRAGPVQPHHRAGPAALAPVAGAGEAGAPARCARGQSGGTGGVCGRCVHGCAADRRCGQHPPVSRRVVAGDHARGWPAGRSRHRLGGAPAVAGGLPQRRHPRVHRSRERRRIQGGLGCARERLRRVRARDRHLDRCGLSQ